MLVPVPVLVPARVQDSRAALRSIDEGPLIKGSEEGGLEASVLFTMLLTVLFCALCASSSSAYSDCPEGSVGISASVTSSSSCDTVLCAV